ncbi:MAG: hypothetical protein ABSE89_08665 [Sedimentisphaerales bacterium]
MKDKFVININIFRDIQAGNLQIGNHTSIHKHPKIRTIGIIGVIAALLTIFHLLGWLEPIRAFIYKILLHR